MAAQSQTTIPDFNTPIPISDTVKTTIAAYPDEAIPISAWMLVRGALTFHEEYGNYLAKRLVSESGPGGGMVKPATTWLDEVIALLDPTQVHEIHGRLFILGLAELDPELARYLDNFGFRDALKGEIKEPYETLLFSNSRQSNPNASQATNPSLISISDTVRTSLEAFPEPTTVSAFTLVDKILSFHNDYGDSDPTAKRAFNSTSAPTMAIRKPASNWLQEVGNLFDSKKVKVIDGRLFILGLCSIDADLAGLLDNIGLRDALKQEILEPFDSLLRPITAQANINLDGVTLNASGTVSTPPPSDQITFRDDAATDADQLGRAGFADALATWLNRIWGENYTSYVSQLEKAYQNQTPLPQSSSFIVHLHGPWGSGKTSLLRLMEKGLRKFTVTFRAKEYIWNVKWLSATRNQQIAQILQGIVKALRKIKFMEGDKERTWTIVWFNAWRNRQIDPVWWPLMDRVYHDIRGSFWENMGFWVWETWWRLGVNGLGENPLVLGLGLVALAGLFVWLTGSASSDGSWLASLQSIGGIVGLASTLGAGILTLSRSLFTASSAQSFARLAQDPMEKVRTHFREMMNRANHPVMVFIDDLDRCQPEYVVRLLESIQTLFNDPRVFYVIAADRRWLYECFEIVYKDFKATVREPGRRTGYLFLEKIFQMSISVPAMSAEVQQAYLDHLYQRARHEVEQKIAEASRQAEVDFAGANTTEALIEKLETPQSDPNPLIQQARREAAVRRLSSQTVSADIEYFLHPFALLLERNPRAMKRLVNAYSVYLALAMLADVQLINNEEKKKRFALWTILSLRWPALAEKLEDDPESLPALLEKKADGLDPDLAALVQDDEVQRLLHGEAKGVGVALDVDTIERLWGLQANTSTPVVA